jgi:hypothetical protein
MDAGDLNRLSEEHLAILANFNASLQLVERSLEDIRHKSCDVGRILYRLLETRSLARATDAQIAKAGELIIMRPLLKRERAA